MEPADHDRGADDLAGEPSRSSDVGGAAQDDARETPLDAALDQWVLACLDRIESEGVAALDAACRERPDLGAGLRRRLGSLERLGLLTAPPPGVAPDAPDVAAAPARLASYRLIEPLGGGGMGAVYLAIDEKLGREVALKLIHPELLLFPGTRERFHREVETVARLDHPGIVPIFEVGEERGVPYFAMPRIHGRSLAQVIRSLRDRSPGSLRGRDLIEAAVDPSSGTARVPAPEILGGSWVDGCLRLAIQVADALDHAHRCGVIHRDVKPSNVMLTEDGRAMLFDFGLARSRGATELTRTGSRVGSLHYMAPEQLRGTAGAVSERTDVYALGVTLFELLGLRAAVSGDTESEVLKRVLAGPEVPLRRRNPVVPHDVVVVCRKAMDPDPARRYARASDFARDLENALTRRPIEARPANPFYVAWRFASRHRAGSAAVLFLLVAAIGLPTLYAIEQRKARRQVEAKQVRVDEWFTRATEAVDTLLTRVGDQVLSDVPQMESVRRKLLGDALGFYEAFVATEEGDDPGVREQTSVVRIKAGAIAYDLGDLESAERLLREAMVSLSALASDGRESAALWAAEAAAQLTNLLDGTGRREEAESLAIGAIRELVAVRESATRTERLSRLHHESGLVAVMQDPALAADRFEKSLALAESLLSPERVDVVILSRVGTTSSMLGSAHSSLGRHDRAKECFQRSVAAFSDVVKAAPELRESSRDLARARLRLARELERDAPEEALEATRAVMELWEREVADFPSSPYLRWELSYARSEYVRQSATLGRLESAVVIAEQDVREMSDVVTRHPDVVAFRLRLALASNQVSAWSLDLGRIDVAQRAVESGIEHLETIVAHVPDHMDARYHLGGLLHNLAEVREARLDWAGAAEAYERACSLQREVLAKISDHERSRVYLQSHLAGLANARLSLSDHRAAATAARELAECAPGRCDTARMAAELLSRCATVARGDTDLAEDARSGIASEYVRSAFDALRGAGSWPPAEIEAIRASTHLGEVVALPEFATWAASMTETAGSPSRP